MDWLASFQSKPCMARTIPFFMHMLIEKKKKKFHKCTSFSFLKNMLQDQPFYKITKIG